MTGTSTNSDGSARFTTLVVLFVAAFALYGMYCFGTINQVKINGPFYSRIVEGKDVIADVLPPPSYLIEAYLLAFQMYDDADSLELVKQMIVFGGLKDLYAARQAHWHNQLPEGPLRTALVERSHGPGMLMLEVMEKQYIPALQAGEREKALALLRGPIRSEYLAHRAAIDNVVALAVDRNKDDEAEAALAVTSRAYGQLGLGAVLITLLSLVSWRWTRAASGATAARPAQTPA